MNMCRMIEILFTIEAFNSNAAPSGKSVNLGVTVKALRVREISIILSSIIYNISLEQFFIDTYSSAQKIKV